MLVSFLIIALNAEKTLENLLKDLRAQSYDHKKVECIFVDSLSNDSTKELMEAFRRDDKERFYDIKVLDNPRRTLPCGWNVALRESSGEMIIRVDAHASIPPDFIEKNVYYMKQGEMITGGPRKSMVDEGSRWQKTLLLAETSMFGSGIARYRSSEKTQYVKTLAHAAYRRRVFETVGGYDERLTRTEDNEIHHRMREAGFQFFFSSDIRSYHYVRDSFRRMLRQKFQNGRYIGLTMGISPACFSLYHFIPLAFTLAMIGSLLLFLFGQAWFLQIVGLSYLCVNLGMTALSIAKGGFEISHLVLPFLFLFLHLSYGFGTLYGLFCMPFFRNRPENRECTAIEEVRRRMEEHEQAERERKSGQEGRGSHGE